MKKKANQLSDLKVVPFKEPKQLEKIKGGGVTCSGACSCYFQNDNETSTNNAKENMILFL